MFLPHFKTLTGASNPTSLRSDKGKSGSVHIYGRQLQGGIPLASQPSAGHLSILNRKMCLFLFVLQSFVLLYGRDFVWKKKTAGQSQIAALFSVL